MDSTLYEDISIKTDLSSIRIASDKITNFCINNLVPHSNIDRLTICLNEVLANIVEHGGENAMQSPIDIQIKLSSRENKNIVSVSVMDKGVSFNPVKTKPKTLESTLEDAVPGGLGLTMIINFADELLYERVNEFNKFTFSVLW